MEERKQTDWSFKQHFALRTGTMLLAFSGALLALSFSGAAAIVMQLIPASTDIFWRLNSSFAKYQIIAAIFSLFFLARSILKKEPQIQFIIEIIMAGVLFSLY